MTSDPTTAKMHPALVQFMEALARAAARIDHARDEASREATTQPEPTRRKSGQARVDPDEIPDLTGPPCDQVTAKAKVRRGRPKAAPAKVSTTIRVRWIETT